jgi:hypothetical protein
LEEGAGVEVDDEAEGVALEAGRAERSVDSCLEEVMLAGSTTAGMSKSCRAGETGDMVYSKPYGCAGAAVSGFS